MEALSLTCEDAGTPSKSQAYAHRLTGELSGLYLFEIFVLLQR